MRRTVSRHIERHSHPINVRCGVLYGAKKARKRWAFPRSLVVEN